MKVSSCSLQNSLEQDLSEYSNLHLSPAQLFAIDRLREDFLRKRVVSNSAADAAAISEFLAQNSNPGFSSPIGHLLDREIKSILSDIFANADFGCANIFQLADVGPGAVRGDRDDNSFLGKFSGRITYSNPDLLRVFKHACSSDVRWSSIFNDACTTNRFEQQKGGKMTPVPKTMDISRLVVSPLSLDVFTDKGVGIELENVLQDIGIDLKRQPDINREMAKIGSICGKFATIDLKGASNHLSYERWYPLLPEGLKFWLRMTRPSVVFLPDGTEVPLRMIQTMGSGITFPLQTILFFAIASLAYRMVGIPLHTRGHRNVSVFGDDIIVHRKAFIQMISLLKHFDLVVNESKTFCDGSFRESCGADWFEGVNVRPAYLKHTRSREDAFGTVNRLLEWALRLSLPAPVHTICTLLGGRIEPRWFVPQHASENSGIRVPSSLKPFKGNNYVASLPKLSRRTISPEFVELYPHLFALSVLRGEMQSITEKRSTFYCVNVRPTQPSYVRRRCYTPNWDVNPFHVIDDYGRLVTQFGAGFGRVWDTNPKAVTWISLWVHLFFEEMGRTT